ncbi:MAG: IS66 family transposase [Halioglobus sp.]|nr:IS66 family transposase [Halioglobus sp.]
MPNALAKLPDDIDALKALVAEQLARNTRLEQEKVRLNAKVLTLQEQLNLALARRYAASSEKLSPDQIRLFNEAEVDAALDDCGHDEADPEETVAVPAHNRKKGGRKPLPENWPRIEVIHEIPEGQRHCPHDGQLLIEINQIVSEQADIIPAQLRVIRHIRKQYACACGQCIQTAPLPGQPIPKSMASPGLLAHIAVSKYQDALPLYRQEQILQRVGLTIPRATLANWMIRCGQLIQPLINLLRDHLLAYDIVQMDETTVQVLKEPGKTAQSKSYLWLQRGGPPDQPVILFDYDPSRAQTVPMALLEGFAGYLQADGYSGYNGVVTAGSLIHVGCMAHARRKFSEAVKGQGKNPRQGKAHQGLAWIQKLYRIEKQARTQQMSPSERKAHRQQHAAPILKKLRTWLDDSLPTVPPGTLAGKALNYLHNEWPKLIRYLEDGRLEIDNNLAENAIRPFVIGRKNWMFSDSVHGVKASANLYSLVESAKASGLEPYQYLRQVFTALPQAATVEDFENLLPWALKKIPAEIR